MAVVPGTSMEVLQANRTAVLARWVGLAATLLALLAARAVAPHRLMPLVILLGAAALLNTAAWLYLRASARAGLPKPAFHLTLLLHGQLLLDLVVLAVALQQSGGARGPILALCILYAGLLGFVLSRVAAGMLASLAVVALAAALAVSHVDGTLTALGEAAVLDGSGRYPWEHLGFGATFIFLAVAAGGRLRKELERGQEGWRQRALELAVLHQVVEADSAAPDVDAWIGRITQILASTLYPEDVGFLFLDEGERVVRPHPSYHGLGPNPHALAIPLGTGITGTVAREGQPLLVPDVRQDPRYLKVLAHVAAELCVPVRVEGRVRGVLNVETRRSGVLTQEDVHLMATVADHVGAVLARERVLAAERAARRKAESLERVAAVLNSTLELDELLSRVLEHLSRLVPSVSTSVQVLEGDRLRIVAGRGFEQMDQVLGMSFPLEGDNPNRMVIGQGRPLIVPDARASFAAFRTKPHDHIRSWLGVPLVSRGKVIGMIALDRSEVNAFSSEESETALAFANHVAIALENAGRYQATLHQAMTDELTGLYNRRYFRQELEREVVRSRRYQHLVSLLMVDLDDFKRYNDRYGHPAGDQLLKELAGLIRRVVRQTDTAVRYGGEEFAVILPETDAAWALGLAERLRQAIAAHRFVVEGVGPLGQVTASLGVATFPRHARSARALLQAADEALLQAKQGKDRVLLYGSGEARAPVPGESPSDPQAAR
ncbi:diguanylate cyclase [Limnochorda pilosa]|uniref:GGDEF domain-containing protein n=1 Tax=Limnochorda pilosa TaxID=1555112 RepID=A0A0K2SJ96_LIMPI|nr:diguanylate cyclase [Limnochorda pilosa]BAS27150.1 hypothetical protein LIP_1293 [Limnochorda pilosa]